MLIPSSVIMEVSSLCNVSCLGCAFHGPHGFVNRPVGNMKKTVWESLIKEIGSWDKQVRLTAHGGGEPLMNPELKDILLLAKSFPNISTGFLTNGMLLDKNFSEFIINTSLEWVALSIDGVVPETHNQIRHKSDLATVENHLEILLDLKKKKHSDFPKVSINMVAYDIIKDQSDAFVKKWIDKVETVMVSHYRNPPKSKRWPNMPEKRVPCNLLWSQAVVAWDGRLGLCCEDFNIDYSPGKIDENHSLLTLWNAPEFEQVRTLHSHGQFENHPMCGTCDTWAEEYRKEIKNSEGYHITQTPSQTIYTR